MEALASVLTAIILSSTTGAPATLDALADDLARRDVVFIGEEHDNAEGHRAELAIIEALHRRRPDLVISMEMFERDAQGALDDYLRGRIGEDDFLKRARPWKSYKSDYREIIEFARAKQLDVIAANVPTPLSRRVSSKGMDAVAGEAGLPRATTHPNDRYLALFREAMKDHVGANAEEALLKMYEAQCLKDDGMAEALVDYHVQHLHRHPLIVHLCGKFHCEYGLGTAWRVASRRPILQLGIVTMVAAEEKEKVKADDHRERGHYVLAVAAPPKKPDEKKPDDKTPVADATKSDKPDQGAGAKKDGKPVPEAPDDADAAPALGIMPDYAATELPGVVIGAAREDGAAAKAGMKDGDRIIKMGGNGVKDMEGYMEAMSGFHAGQTIEVVAVRQGAEKTFKVKLGARPRN